jgi:hypothetical protein
MKVASVEDQKCRTERPCRSVRNRHWTLPAVAVTHRSSPFREGNTSAPAGVANRSAVVPDDDASGHVFRGTKPMRDGFRCATALVLWLGVTVPCAAQNASTPQTHDPRGCSDAKAGKTAPQPSPGNQTLSERLEQTDGVICPPNVDPDIRAPTPQGGNMPVIPPPGGPGGDPTVRPK